MNPRESSKLPAPLAIFSPFWLISSSAQHVSATEDATSNAEIRFRWLMLAMACHDPSRVDAAIAMALEAILPRIFVSCIVC